MVNEWDFFFHLLIGHLYFFLKVMSAQIICDFIFHYISCLLVIYSQCYEFWILISCLMKLQTLFDLRLVV